MARSAAAITSFFRWAGALAVAASCATAARAELLYVSLPLSTNAVVTYDVSLGDATAIRNSQQTFASGTDVAAPQGMAIDQQGNVFVVNQLVNTIGKFDSSGTLLATIGSAAGIKLSGSVSSGYNRYSPPWIRPRNTSALAASGNRQQV
jgi:hypothetical protein